MTQKAQPIGSDQNNNPKDEEKIKKMQRLRVALRVRPIREDERRRGKKAIARAVDDKMVVLGESDGGRNDVLRNKRVGEKQFVFDMAFDEHAKQRDVYAKTTGDLIDFVVAGYTATVFAYGATGAGKTHTMVGTPNEPGVMIRALNDLFTKMNQADNRFTVKMSYLEIYNEAIRDLLRPQASHLDLREDARGGEIKVAGLSEVQTDSTDMVMKLLQKGNKNRTVEATAANKTSSRSHALLQVLVEQEDKFTGTKTKRKFGKLFMIDLAGSERASQTKNEGKRLQEGAHINRSLLALANCINALAQGDAKYVNFRDSKLTRLLKDALSGNCRTVMIAHVSPNPDHRDETYNTLVYADRAKNISNKVRKNVVDVEHHVSQYQNIIEELKGEISRLREKLEGGGEPSKDAVDATFKDRKAQEAHRVKLKALQEQLVANFKDQMDVRQEMLDVENNILALAMEREKEQLIIDEWEAEKTKKKSAMKKGKPSSSSSSNQSGEDSESDVEMEEPEEVAQAWDEIMFINNEEKRYLEMKEDLEKELEEARHKSAALEAEFPQEITDSEQREIYSLLLRVHELEVERVEMQRDALLREHEMRKKELMLLRFDMQRNLCDQIITRQRELLKAHQSQTPEDLDQLYQVYKNESYGATREKDAKLIAQLNEFIRSSTVGIPLRTTRSSTRASGTPGTPGSGSGSGSEINHKLPPISEFKHSGSKPGSPSSRGSSSRASLPPIKDDGPRRASAPDPTQLAKEKEKPPNLASIQRKAETRRTSVASLEEKNRRRAPVPPSKQTGIRASKSEDNVQRITKYRKDPMPRPVPTRPEIKVENKRNKNVNAGGGGYNIRMTR